MYRFTKSLTCTVNTNGSSERINIRNLVSHDHNTLFGTHKFFECLCLYSGFDSGSLFHLLRLTAIISNLLTILDYDLVTATSKCHLDRNT